MRKLAEQLIQELFIRKAFKKYKNGLPTKSDSEIQKWIITFWLTQ